MTKLVKKVVVAKKTVMKINKLIVVAKAHHVSKKVIKALVKKVTIAKK